MPELFDIGDVATARATFRDRDGDLANPTTVVGRQRKPSGVTSNVTFANVSPGVYEADLPIDEAGDWWVRATGTGAVAASVEGIFTVRSRRVS